MLNRATEDGFRSWLQYEEATEIVGIANHTQECPLVSYYKYLNPGYTVIGIVNGLVYYGYHSWFWTNEHVILEDWEIGFVSRIDDGIDGTGTPVNAQQCLQVLDGKRLIEVLLENKVTISNE